MYTYMYMCAHTYVYCIHIDVHIHIVYYLLAYICICMLVDSGSRAREGRQPFNIDCGKEFGFYCRCTWKLLNLSKRMI